MAHTPLLPQRRSCCDRLLFFFLIAGCGPSAAFGQATADEPGPTLVIRANQDVAEDLIVFAKSVEVSGIARKGIAAFGGHVTVDGTVRGDVAVVGGSLYVRNGGIVHGDVIVVGGTLQREPQGRIDGRVFSTSVYEDKLVNLFTQPSKELLSVDYSMRAVGWRLLKIATWFLLSVLLLKAFPLQIAYAARSLRENVGRTSLLGLMAIVALMTALFVFLILCIVVIGVPLLIIWVLFCAACWIFGSVVVYLTFGQLISRPFLKDPTLSPALVLLNGVMVCGLLRMVPILGFLLPYVVLVLALGTVIGTKFGTGSSWFRSPVLDV